MENPSVFTKSCTIGTFEFAKDLCDLGASIMILSIYKQQGLRFLKPTIMRLMMVNRSVNG